MTYKSPLKKLVKYFESSRNKWKARALERQKKLAEQEVTIRDLKESRSSWKKKYKELKTKLESKAKKENKSNSPSQDFDRPVIEHPTILEGELIKKGEIKVAPWERPSYHSYQLCTIDIAIKQILFSLNSFRGAMKTFEIFSKYYPIQKPSWVTIENWVLRLGLYELEKAIDKRADWIYILDHTVQLGQQKCLCILGVTLEQLNLGLSSPITIDVEQPLPTLKYLQSDAIASPSKFNLSHQDVQILKMSVNEHCNGELICQYLNELAQQTGTPIQIISDHGPDINKGVNLFIESHPNTIYTYDITHAIGLLLKKLLADNPSWKKFLSWSSSLRQKILQTELGFLAPPALRHKSRYLNLAPLINWANNLLRYQKKANFTLINSNYNTDKQTLIKLIFEQVTDFEKQLLAGKTYLTAEQLIDDIEEKIGPVRCTQLQARLLEYTQIGKQRFDEYFAGINQFEHFIRHLSLLVEITQIVEKQIKNQGLHLDSAAIFRQAIFGKKLSNQLAEQFIQGIEQYLNNEGQNMKPGQILPASSDVIESIFGKYKLFTSQCKLQSISKLILTIPAFTANITLDKIKQAFETVRSIDVQKWVDDNLGPSIIAKRKQALK